MTIEEFMPYYEKLCFAFDREFKDGQAMTYFEYLHTFKREAMKYATDQSIIYQKWPRMPFIAELIDCMKEYREIIPTERQLSSNEEPATDEQREACLKSIKDYLSRQ